MKILTLTRNPCFENYAADWSPEQAETLWASFTAYPRIRSNIMERVYRWEPTSQNKPQTQTLGDLVCNDSWKVFSFYLFIFYTFWFYIMVHYYTNVQNKRKKIIKHPWVPNSIQLKISYTSITTTTTTTTASMFFSTLAWSPIVCTVIIMFKKCESDMIGRFGVIVFTFIQQSSWFIETREAQQNQNRLYWPCVHIQGIWQQFLSWS